MKKLFFLRGRGKKKANKAYVIAVMKNFRKQKGGGTKFRRR